MDTITLLLFVVGLALLIGGAEVLLRRATHLAAALEISPLVIGLTVVAFGTSAPELAVTVQSPCEAIYPVEDKNSLCNRWRGRHIL